MDNYLTLLGSIVIGGLMLINFVNYQADLRDHTFVQNGELILQQSAIEVVEMVEADLRKIGAGVDYPPLAVSDDNAITFYADLENDGVMDTVRYYLSDASAASATPNPNDKIFYREVNGVNTYEGAFGLTDFGIEFFDANNDATDNLYKVKALEVTMSFESTIPYDEEYASYVWRERLTPPNMLSL